MKLRFDINGTIRKSASRIRNILAPGSLLLMYHRVGKADADPWSLAVSPEHFAEHLEVIRKFAHPIRVQELSQQLGGKRQRRSVALTFDDGYADNLLQATPILERFDVPATIFVVSGGVGSQKEFWWDELEQLLLQPGILPEHFEISVGGNTHSWDLGPAVEFTLEEYQLFHTHSASQASDSSPRYQLFRSFYSLIRPLYHEERRRVLDELAEWSGIRLVLRPAYRPLSPVELYQLDQYELIEIGAHTVTHPMLSELPTALQEAEIRQSKEQLQEWLAHPVESFSYPYGKYTPETVRIVRSSGFTSACSTIPGTLRPGSDLFQLPRLEVRDWDGDELHRRLSAWDWD